MTCLPEMILIFNMSKKKLCFFCFKAFLSGFLKQSRNKTNSYAGLPLTAKGGQMTGSSPNQNEEEPEKFLKQSVFGELIINKKAIGESVESQ